MRLGLLGRIRKLPVAVSCGDADQFRGSVGCGGLLQVIRRFDLFDVRGLDEGRHRHLFLYRWGLAALVDGVPRHRRSIRVGHRAVRIDELNVLQWYLFRRGARRVHRTRCARGRLRLLTAPSTVVRLLSGRLSNKLGRSRDCLRMLG